MPVGEGGVALVTAASIAIHRILNAPISTRCVIAANEGAMRLKDRREWRSFSFQRWGGVALLTWLSRSNPLVPGSRRFNAWDDCPYLCVGFNCGDSHRPLVKVLKRLLLICTSVESGNEASLCVRRRSRPQPNSHFAGVDDHTPSTPLAGLHQPEPLDRDPRVMMSRPVFGGFDVHPWNEATRVHRGTGWRCGMAAGGAGTAAWEDLSGGFARRWCCDWCNRPCY